MYTQDAGAPQLPMEFLEDLTYYFDVGESNRFFDVNTIIYNNLESYKLYSFMKGLAGAYINSYNYANDIPFNIYYFETMCNAELLLDLVEQNDYSNSLKNLCGMLGSNFMEAYSLVKEYDKMFEDISDMIVEEDDDCIIVNMCSVASVFTGLWLCSKIKRKNPTVAIIAIGNQINVPYVAKLSVDLRIIDRIEQPSFLHKKKLSRLELFRAIGLKEIIKKYPLYYGIRIIPYQISFGCSSKCNFCTERMIWDKTGTVKDDLVIFDYDACKLEIEYLVNECKVGGLTFNDCTFDLRIPIFAKIGRLIKETDLFFSASSRIDLIDEEYIANLSEMNCTALLIGLETLNKNSIKIFNKGDECYGDTAVEAVKKLYENNIVTQINIVLFHPNESYEDVKQSISEVLDFLERVRSIGAIVPKLNVGEMVINYPSCNYFNIMADVETIIEYHSSEILKDIPFKVCYPRKENGQAKNTLISSIIEDSESVDSVVFNTVALLSGHWELFYKKWKTDNIIITFNNRQEKRTVLEAFRKYHVDKIDEDPIKISQFPLNERDIKNFVTEVLLFYVLNLIELEGLK